MGKSVLYFCTCKLIKKLLFLEREDVSVILLNQKFEQNVIG